MLAGSAMIAHGRGEAFDYLLGERTTPSATAASRQTLAVLQAAKRPRLSVNGNVAALACDDMLRLADALQCPLEVNIFYRTPERMEAILSYINERKNALGLDVCFGRCSTPPFLASRAQERRVIVKEFWKVHDSCSP